MRQTFIYAIAAAVIILGWSATAQPTLRRDGAGSVTTPGLIAHFLPEEGRATAVTVIDPQTKVMSVYHIGRENGQIQLKSVRPLQWDMEMTGYNTADPTPQEIRAGLERRP